MTSSLAAPFFASLFGALIQELSHWYQMRNRISQEKYKKIISSKAYWYITTLMIISTPFGVILWFYDSLEFLRMRDFVIFGAAFPLAFKSIVASAKANLEQVRLGDADSLAKVYLGLSS